jgi:hypothetical protein
MRSRRIRRHAAGVDDGLHQPDRVGALSASTAVFTSSVIDLSLPANPRGAEQLKVNEARDRLGPMRSKSVTASAA